MPAESVLVNFVYCHPVGHAVEALQYSLGFPRADPKEPSLWGGLARARVRFVGVEPDIRGIDETVTREVDSGIAELVPDLEVPDAWTLCVNGTPQSHVDLDRTYCESLSHSLLELGKLVVVGRICGHKKPATLRGIATFPVTFR